MIATAAHWSTQTVEAFLGTLPWRGSTITSLAALNVAPKPLDWRSQTVGDFFSNVAWDGNYFPQLHSDPQAPQSLSYLLPIQAFFGCFAWEGRPNIGVVPQFTVSPSRTTDISLDDLSDLF